MSDNSIFELHEKAVEVLREALSLEASRWMFHNDALLQRAWDVLHEIDEVSKK